MSPINELTQVCAYFFEVLIKHFLALEQNISKKSGLLSLFKKINCVYRNIRTAIPETSGHETGGIRTLCRLT